MELERELEARKRRECGPEARPYERSQPTWSASRQRGVERYNEALRALRTRLCQPCSGPSCRDQVEAIVTDLDVSTCSFETEEDVLDLTPTGAMRWGSETVDPMCGGRVVQLLGGGPASARAITSKMVESFQCTPDTSRDVDREAVAVALQPGWQRTAPTGAPMLVNAREVLVRPTLLTAAPGVPLGRARRALGPPPRPTTSRLTRRQLSAILRPRVHLPRFLPMGGLVVCEGDEGARRDRHG